MYPVIECNYTNLHFCTFTIVNVREFHQIVLHHCLVIFCTKINIWDRDLRLVYQMDELSPVVAVSYANYSANCGAPALGVHSTSGWSSRMVLFSIYLVPCRFCIRLQVLSLQHVLLLEQIVASGINVLRILIIPYFIFLDVLGVGVIAHDIIYF